VGTYTHISCFAHRTRDREQEPICALDREWYQPLRMLDANSHKSHKKLSLTNNSSNNFLPCPSLNLFIVLSAWLAVLLNQFFKQFLTLPFSQSIHRPVSWQSCSTVCHCTHGSKQLQKERKGDNRRDAVDFAARGGSKTETKTLHQTVAAFVLIMTGALVAHVVNVIAVMQYNVWFLLDCTIKLAALS
jgi:hypothetical protein